MEKRRSSIVPRGFSRYYILFLLKEKPMTGKEIMDEAEKRSGGVWRPSPGLVYPHLGRLNARGLIEEVDGKFAVTPKGEEALNRYIKDEEEIRKRMNVLKKLSDQLFATSRFLMNEALDGLQAGFVMIQENLAKVSREKREWFLTEYRKRLGKELKRVEAELKKMTMPEVANTT